MLRNELINDVTEYHNDTVTVDVNGIAVDIVAATRRGGGIVLLLDQEGLKRALESVVIGRRRPAIIPGLGVGRLQ